MLKQLATAAIAIAVPLNPAVAQQKVSSPQDVSSAIGTCIKATSPEGVDEAKLAEAGFARGKIESKGKTVESDLSFYGRPNNPAIIITLTDPNPTCTVVARIPNVQRYPTLVEGISLALQSKPIQQKGNEFTWRRGNSLIQIAATGTREQPAIRTVVLAMKEKK